VFCGGCGGIGGDGAGGDCILLSPTLQGIDSSLIFNEDSDSEVFDGTSHSSSVEHPFARTNSSSSSRKSSCYEAALPTDDKLPGSAAEPPNLELGMSMMETTPTNSTACSPVNPSTVEWKPRLLAEQEAAALDSPRNDSNSERSISPQQDLKALYGSTVTVTIDPPRDVGGVEVDDEVSRYLNGMVEGSSEPRSLADVFGKDSVGVADEEHNLFKDLNEMDLIEEEDTEPPPPTKICLLSKYECKCDLSC